MRALVLLSAFVLLALVMWLTVRTIRRARVDAHSYAPWRVEHRASGGATIVEVVRRSETGRLLGSIVVGNVPDDDPEWLDHRAKAWAEAEQRAVELNANNREVS